MKYSIDKQDSYTVFKLQEEKLDTVLAPSLKSELVTLNAEGVENIILDLSEVKYTDSSGLSAILVGNRVFGESNGFFVIANVKDHVMKLIKISQLDSVLNITETVEEAIEGILEELEKEKDNEE
jgi:anti-anti-sigma factor